MGFTLNINNILRSDEYQDLSVGKQYEFQKTGSNLLVDTIQIWLTKLDWTPLAEIQVVKQTREKDNTFGEFEVKYIYPEVEQLILKQLFERMYGW